MSVDARREAFERVGGRFDARVLEPSPPAVDAAPWFADDPVAPEPRTPGLPLLGPVSNADITWDEITRDEPDLSEWCAARWLGACRRLGPLPDDDVLLATRTALHSVAEQVLAPVRRRATGKIGLRYTVGGFGTPFFGADEQARVDGVDLVVVLAGREARAPITTIADAGRFVGIGPGPPADLYTPATTVDPDAALSVDPDAARAIGDWYGFSCSVLEEVRVVAGATDSRTQLWPEHFDLSADAGDEAAGTRGTFGSSPGDATHPQPYLYVTHWAADVAPDPFWNDPAFGGASLPYAALLGVEDQRTAALDFFRTGLSTLSSLAGRGR
jgi:hypothetical protein